MTSGSPVSPLWLAIDTATDIASVAIGTADRVMAGQSMRGARQHAAQIIPLIEAVSGDSGITLAQISGLIVGDGPGSFTGLRIAWAAAKGLAQVRELPLFAIPSLLGAAHAAAQGERGRRPIAACFDALRGQVFAAIYRFASGRVDTVVAPRLFEIRELAQIAADRPVIAVGDGAVRYASEIREWTGRPPLALENVPPIAASLLTLSLDETARRAVDASSEPIYGRPAEAQVKWEARYGRPLPHSSR